MGNNEGTGDNNGMVAGSSRLSHYESERVETLKLYLHMIGVGSDVSQTKARVQERVLELFAERRESVRITELEGEIASAIQRAGQPDVFEPEFGREEYKFRLYEDEKRKIIVDYYVQPGKKGEEQRPDEGFYVYTPSGLRVVRASQAELGSGVLGVAYIGLGLIKILESLHGQDYKEVLKHEVLHHKYPMESERAIRMRTSSELPFPTRYQNCY